VCRGASATHIPSGPQGTPNTLIDRKQQGRPRLIDPIPEDQSKDAVIKLLPNNPVEKVIHINK
jgi:hypothetical protein